MQAGSIARRIGGIVFGLILIAIGAVMVWWGGKLLMLGGSFYYLPAGLATLITGIAVLLGRWRRGGWIFLALMVVTLVWSLAEAGLDGWALMPRLLAPFVLGLPFLILALASGKGKARIAGLAALGVAIVLVGSLWTRSGYTPPDTAARPAVAQGADADADADAEGDWAHFGGTSQGRHFSQLTQINRDNVTTLEEAWSIKLGPFPMPPIAQLQTVSLQAGELLYNCSPFSDVIASEPETGKIRWQFDAKPDVSGHFLSKCRGVAYYEVPEAQEQCAQRVYVAATDGRLIALDAANGKLCKGFGDDGIVDLKKGIVQRNPGFYRNTSAPTIVRGKIVLGSAVADGQYAGEPSGVVRAFDAVTGTLAWAWDVDNPDKHDEPAEGENYGQGTPNAWGPLSGDDALGLVYAPLGNATPDYYGGHRSEGSNKYASSVVALDIETGELRWYFQTVHYDVWDYDIASQPVLFDWHGKDGEVVPALLQPTKRGQTFVFDRRDGTPLFPIEERPAPQEGSVEQLARTQPWSTGFARLDRPVLEERDMWGISALDQLWCRIKFREARYDGYFTPPGVTPSIADPGYTGGTNWGSFSVDTTRQLGFTLSFQLVNYIRLIPRDSDEARELKASSTGNLGGPAAQEGTPYAAHISPFVSPLGIPCQEPPFGLINAIDLSTGEMVWRRPIGSARDLGPMGIRSHLPLTIGTPPFGGTMATAGGLVFSGGSQDHAFRAYDSETGDLLFEADLPGTSATRPMTFQSEKDGRQYIVVASDAPMTGGKQNGVITAFALPQS
ncbi:MAG: membrane-bound PQQ-dependent dehydrogenase, glucose/quinate/shikimate family [Sphingomonadaceae bacterium]|nr:membrane-bound PQQ-dependent dehydrogenase, glucose/quinate/shikimate family [Sphingomonadaceae bacterium]